MLNLSPLQEPGQEQRAEVTGSLCPQDAGGVRVRGKGLTHRWTSSFPPISSSLGGHSIRASVVIQMAPRWQLQGPPPHHSLPGQRPRLTGEQWELSLLKAGAYRWETATLEEKYLVAPFLHPVPAVMGYQNSGFKMLINTVSYRWYHLCLAGSTLPGFARKFQRTLKNWIVGFSS